MTAICRILQHASIVAIRITLQSKINNRKRYTTTRNHNFVPIQDIIWLIANYKKKKKKRKNKWKEFFHLPPELIASN